MATLTSAGLWAPWLWPLVEEQSKAQRGLVTCEKSQNPQHHRTTSVGVDSEADAKMGILDPLSNEGDLRLWVADRE